MHHSDVYLTIICATKCKWIIVDAIRFAEMVASKMKTKNDNNSPERRMAPSTGATLETHNILIDTNRTIEWNIIIIPRNQCQLTMYCHHIESNVSTMLREWVNMKSWMLQSDAITVRFNVLLLARAADRIIRLRVLFKMFPSNLIHLLHCISSAENCLAPKPPRIL